MIRALPFLALLGCWSGSTPPAASATAPRRAPTLAFDDDFPGRLLFDRAGLAWEVQCTGNRLTKRPWQGGTRVDVARCNYADRTEVSPGMPPQAPALAIEGDTVALFSWDDHAIVVTRRGTEIERYPVSERIGVAGLAIDGNAILAIVHGAPEPGQSVGGVALGNSLAAIVRLEDGTGRLHELVRYASTGPSVDPLFVAAGRTHMLLVAKTGNTITCDYQMRCGKPRLTGVGEIHTYAQLPDGGMIVLDWESSISRLGASGVPVWTTTKIDPWSLVGTTASQVWFTTRPDDPRQRGLVVRALSLADGRVEGDPAFLFPDREEFGRYLVLFGVAPTPDGTAIRGLFGGTLTAGSATLATRTLGGLCWWKNPHDDDEYEVKPEKRCTGRRHRKAIVTAKRPFLAVGVEELRAKKWTRRSP